jgi:hypothetical protein
MVLPNVVRGPSALESGDASSQHSVKFIDQQINRFVRVFGLHRRLEIRTSNLDMTLGSKQAEATSMIAVYVDADS